MSARLRAWLPPTSMGRAARICYGAAGAAFFLAGALWLLPRPFRSEVGPLTRVERPSEQAAFPHPVVQLSVFRDSLVEAWVSDFVDLRTDGVVDSVQIPPRPAPTRGEAGWRIYMRSASHKRSFRIAKPQPHDAPALAWSPFEESAHRVRRFVQFAAIPSADATPGRFDPSLVVRGRRGDPRAALLAWLGVVLVVAPTAARRLLPRLAPRWGGVLVFGIVLINLWLLWGRNWVDWDEVGIIEPAREMFLKGRYDPPGFVYPHLLMYLHTLATIAYSLYLPSTGEVAFHDPFTNQMYFQGAALEPRTIYGSVHLQRLLFGEGYRARAFEAANRIVRNAYTVAGSIGILLLYGLTRRVSGERAALMAGLALAVQPLWLYQSIQILPNMPAALALLLFAWALLRPLNRDRDLLAVSVLGGLVAGFKYNPTPIVILLGLVGFDRAPGTRARAYGLALLGLAVGFLLGYPTLLAQIHRFIAEVGFAAFHYGHWAHPYFEVDEALPALRHQLYLWPRYGGNYLIAILAAVGTLRLLWACQTREGLRVCWILLGIPIVNVLYLSRQLVQFGRNYCGVLAFVCLLAGLGADALLGALSSRVRDPRWRRCLAFSGAAVMALVMLSIARDLWLGRELWKSPTAREQAIRWINANGRLGDSVGVIEPSFAAYQGVMLDWRRFTVRRLTQEQPLDPSELEGFDYLLVAGLGTPNLSRPLLLMKQFGPAGQFGLPPHYRIYGSPR